MGYKGLRFHSDEVNFVQLHRFHKDTHEIYKLSELIHVISETSRSLGKGFE